MADPIIEQRAGYVLKTRGSAAGMPIAAEYLCPEHGRFTIDAIRDANGDAPADARCPTPVDGPDYPGQLDCGERSPFAISAPRGKVKLVEVVRGGYEKPERETWTNTENLGEGQDIDEWQDERDKVWERDRENSIKEILNDR